MTEVARAVTSADRTLGHASGAKPKRGARPRAAAAPGPLLGPVSPGSVLAAQRLAGNRAVGAVLASSGSVVQRDDWGIELPDIEIPSLGDVLRQVPYYEEITTVLGFDPVTGEAVEPAPSRLIRELFAFVGAEHVYDQIAEFEVVQPVVELIDSELDAADLTSARLSRMVDQAWDEVDLTPRIGMIDDAVALVERHLTVLIADVERFATRLLDRVIEIVKDAAIGQAEALLSESESAAKAWELAKLVMGHDPLRDQPVSTSTEQIIEAFLLLIGREQELEMMRAQGTMAATVDWINGHLATFDSILGDFEALVDGVLSALTVEELPNLAANVTRLSQQGLALINRVANFATTVAAEVLQLIKDSLLETADEHAQEVPGFHLVTALAGRNPVTDKPVDQGPEQIIKGFITLIPGGQEQYEQMAETGVINDAANRIQGAIDELGITWEFVSNLFSELWDSFTIEDLLVPVEAIERVVNRFGEPIGRLVAFVRVVVEEVFKLVVDLTGFPSDLIENIVANAMSAFDRIQEDPAQFFINMLEALKLGFSNFFDNIGEYLLSGLASWLFRGLERAGITIPDEITLESILGVVFQVLGLSEDRLWAKLGERLGSETVEAIRAGMDRLSGIWNFISDVTENGIAAVWRYIESQVSNLWDTILEKAQEWVLTEIIEAVIVKLVSMLDPTGIMAVVRSLQAVYNAIESAVEYMRDMLVIIDRYVATIAEIAQGSLESGATQFEEGLAASLPVAIGFLANQAGFGDVAEEIQRIIQGIQEVVDQALDWLLDRAIEAGGAILGALGVGDAQQADNAPGSVPAQDETTDADLDPTDHHAMAVRAVERLEAVEGDGTYDGLRDAMAAEAQRLERSYSAMLEPGIAMSVLFTEPNQDEADADVDFRVRIAPNTEEQSGSNEAAEQIGHARQNGAAGGEVLVGKRDPYDSLADVQDPRKKEIPSLALYREHVIPRHYVQAIAQGLEGAGVARGGGLYERMVIVLMYGGAKPHKDRSDPKPEDAEEAVERARQAASGRPTESGRRLEMKDKLIEHVSTDIFGERVDGSHEAVADDNKGAGGTARGTTGDAKPTREEIKNAATRQLRQIIEILGDACEHALDVREERGRPDRPGSGPAQESAYTISQQIAHGFAGTPPDTYRNYLTRVPLGSRGGALAILNFPTADSWQITLRNRTEGTGPVNAGAFAAISARLNELKTLNNAGASSDRVYPEDYRRRAVEMFEALRPSMGSDLSAAESVAETIQESPTAGAKPHPSTIVRWSKASTAA